MNKEALGFWQRATQALRTASLLVSSDPDASASRAYYAAFFAVSALFALEEKTFSKHSAVESAVHRDLVKSGRWPGELGADYALLRGIRATGDYGGIDRVSESHAREAVEAARRILTAVHENRPDAFHLPQS